jgi:hypothetical protein
VTILPAAVVSTNIITADAAEDNVRSKLNENEQKIYDAYVYLDSKIMGFGSEITASNMKDYGTSNFFTMYSGLDEKKKYSTEDLRYARRAYVYANPLELDGAMAQIKFLYVKNKSDKYSCFAYLQRTDEDEYSYQRKRLKNTIKRIKKTFDDDDSEFDAEVKIANYILNNVTYSAIKIDNYDLRNTAYGALVWHKASSQGFAAAFALLLKEADIDNNILFNASKCWNQVKIGSTRYETDLINCDKTKINLAGSRFNISTKEMKSDGLSRVDYCTEFPTSSGKAKDTRTKLKKYNHSVLGNTANLGVAVLNADNTVTRTTLTQDEQAVNIVPVLKYNNELKNLSGLLKSATIAPDANSAFTWTEWSKSTPYFTLTKNGTGTSRTLNITLVYKKSADLDETTVTYSVTLNDVPTDTQNFTYKVTGENAATLVKCTKKNIKNAVIPSTVTINGKVYNVTKIEKNAFKKCKKLESVTIGCYVKEIGADAFSGKTKLVYVETLGNKITKLGKNAFKSADNGTMFLLRSTSKSKYKKLVKKIQKAGGKYSAFKMRTA